MSNPLSPATRVARPACGFRAGPVVLISVMVLATLAGCAAPRTKMPEVTTEAGKIEAAKQMQLALNADIQARRRLHRIGYRLLKAGLPVCSGQEGYRSGFYLWNRQQFPQLWREAATALYGVSGKPQISEIVPGSPARDSALAVGDELLKIGQWEVPGGDDVLAQVSRHLAEILNSGQAINLTVRRDSQPLTVRIVPGKVCDYALLLVNKEAKNAFADGKRIVVYRGLLDFLRTDTEVATVVAHEMAHNTMGHIDARKTNAAVGGVFGLIFDVAAAVVGVNTQGEFTRLGMGVGAGVYSVDFEREADYVGAYLMAMAGYDPAQAPLLWRRMAIQNPRSIQLRTTHPTTPERFVALEKAVAEIQGKQAQGLPLMPEMRPATRAVSKPQNQDN